MLPPGERRKAKVINVLPPGNAGGESKGSTTTRNTSYGAYATGRVLPPGERRKAKVINVLLSKNAEGESKKNAVIKNTSYGAYDINKVLPPRKYYRREL